MTEHNYRCLLPNSVIEYDNFNLCKSYNKIYFLIDYSNIYNNNHTQYSDSIGLFVIINRIENNELFLNEFFNFLGSSKIIELHLISTIALTDVIKYMNKYAMSDLKKFNVMPLTYGSTFKPELTDLQKFFEIYHDLETLKLKHVIIDELCMNEICKYIKGNQYLKTLALHHNDFSEEHLKILCENISLNNKLENIEVLNNHTEKTIPDISYLKIFGHDTNIIFENLMHNINIKNIKIYEQDAYNEMKFWKFETIEKYDYVVDFQSLNLKYFFECNIKAQAKHHNFFILLCCTKRNNLTRCIPKYIKFLICDYVDLCCIEDKIKLITNIYDKKVTVDKSVIPHKYKITDKVCITA